MTSRQRLAGENLQAPSNHRRKHCLQSFQCASQRGGMNYSFTLDQSGFVEGSNLVQQNEP